MKYPYETDEYKIFTCQSGRQYEVYKNGRVIALPYEYVDTYGSGRHRSFSRKECKPSKTNSGYFELNLGGRKKKKGGEKWQLHRLVATVWLPNPDNLSTVNHIDGDKGNNCVENLEWCSLPENITKGFEDGLFERCGSLHSRYIRWRNGHRNIDPLTKQRLLREALSSDDISKKYNLSKDQINRLKTQKSCDEQELFLMAYYWEKVIKTLNFLRDMYIKTKNEKYFITIRQLLPMGYNYKYTWTANYAVLRNIYFQRKNHRLEEWHEFCEWIESLPYASYLLTYERNKDGHT